MDQATADHCHLSRHEAQARHRAGALDQIPTHHRQAAARQALDGRQFKGTPINEAFLPMPCWPVGQYSRQNPFSHCYFSEQILASRQQISQKSRMISKMLTKCDARD